MIDAVTQRPRARLDLLEQFVYLGETAGVEVAERYFAAVQETCALLIEQPQSGAPYKSRIREAGGFAPCACQELWELPAVLYAPCTGH